MVSRTGARCNEIRVRAAICRADSMGELTQ